MDAKVTIVTFCDIFQYEAGKKSRYSDEYRNLSALILLGKQDMAGLNLKDGQRVMASNEQGRIVALVKASEDDSHPGLAFMTNSPWSNQLMREDICEPSIPGFKRIEAVVTPTDEAITQITELLQRMLA